MTTEYRQKLIEALQMIGEELIRNADKYVGEENDLPATGVFVSAYLDGTNLEIPPLNIEHCYICKGAAEKYTASRDTCRADACELSN